MKIFYIFLIVILITFSPSNLKADDESQVDSTNVIEYPEKMSSHETWKKVISIPGKIIESMQKNIPGVSDFNIVESKSLELSDGSAAHMFTFDFVWVDGKTVMDSVIIAAYKGDALITASGNTVRGLGYGVEELTEVCMTLKLSI